MTDKRRLKRCPICGCTEHRIFGCATHWLTHKRIDYDKCVVRKKWKNNKLINKDNDWLVAMKPRCYMLLLSERHIDWKYRRVDGTTFWCDDYAKKEHLSTYRFVLSSVNYTALYKKTPLKCRLSIIICFTWLVSGIAVLWFSSNRIASLIVLLSISLFRMLEVFSATPAAILPPDGLHCVRKILHHSELR
jgi:hypothetical protein